MAWIDVKTLTFGADTVIRQRGDQTEGFLGHRISINGTPGTASPLAEIASNGIYRAMDAAFNLKTVPLPELSAAVEGGALFPAGPVTVTCSSVDFVGFNTSFSVCDGAGALHSWAYGNNAGAGGDDDFIDSGGGPDSDTIATRIKTRIDAIVPLGLTVVRALNVLTISSPNGLVVFSSDDGVVVS